MSYSPLQKAFALLPSEFSHNQLINALKKSGRGINPQSAIHRYRTQGLVKPIGHHVYQKVS